MDFKRVNRSDIVGFKKSKTAVVEALIQTNAFNRTGTTNYNIFGQKDGIGFEEATEKFIDNFLLRVLVPDYNIKHGKNIFVGSQNRMIRELLDAHGLTKCVVKAIVFAPCHNPSSDMIQRMPQRDIEKTANTYYYQEYKVACPNIDYETVMKFIRGEDYKRVGFYLKDIDITMDYVGSFSLIHLSKINIIHYFKKVLKKHFLFKYSADDDDFIYY